MKESEECRKLLQLAYLSRASSSLPSDEIFNIIEISASNNLRDDLTGFLIYSGDRFFQVVEGPEDAVEELLLRLGRDRRHSGIEIVSRMQVEERSFPNWRMKRLDPDSQLLFSAGTGSGLDSFPAHLRYYVTQFHSTSSPRVTAA